MQTCHIQAACLVINIFVYTGIESLHFFTVDFEASNNTLNARNFCQFDVEWKNCNACADAI